MIKDNSELYRNPYENNPLVKTGYKERSGQYSPLSYSSNQDKVYDLAVDNIMSLYGKIGSGNDVDYDTRFAIDSIISLATGKDYMEVSRNHDMYTRMFTGDTLEDKTIWKAFTDDFQSHNIQRKIADKQNKLDLTNDPEKINRLEREIEELEKDLIKHSDLQDRGFLGNSFVGTGSITNQMLRASANVLLATVIGGMAPMKLASTAIGDSGFLKEGLKSTLKMMTSPNKMTGLGILFNKLDTFMVERGSASREMSLLTDSNGKHIDNTARQIASTVYGIFSTGIEYMSNPIFDDFLKGKATKKIIKDSVLGYALHGGFEILKGGTSEALEEFFQSSLNVVATDLAKAYSNSNGTEFNVSIADTFENALGEGASAFIQAFGPSLLMGVPGNVMSTAMNSFSLKHPVNLDKETIDKARKETKQSYATPSNEDVAGIRLSVGTFQNIDEDATILDFDQIIIPNEAPSKDYSDYKKTATTEAQKLPTIDVVEDENNPGKYRALTDEDSDMLNWMFDKGSLGAAVNVLSTKNDSLRNVEIDTLSEISSAMDFKLQDGMAIFENQEDLDNLTLNDNIRFISEDKSYINAVDSEGNDIQIPIKVRNTNLINSIVDATGGKISEQNAEALATVLSSIKMPDGKNVGIKNISELDANVKALLKDKRGALVVDKLEIILSPNSDETTVEHEGYHIVDILDNEHREQLVKAISDVAHDEKAYAELIDVLDEHKNQLGGKSVEEFIELLEKMNSTNENDDDMREARASLYEVWRETMDEEDYKKLPKSLSDAFKLIAEAFKRIYNNLTGHKLDSRISDAFSQMYGNQNTSNTSLKEDDSILFQTKRNGEYEEIRNKYINTDQWMKAPNGKPTNLSEEQWITVRTPSFKRWFGDWENDPENASKMLDENGEPKLFSHRSPYVFDTFSKDKIGTTTDTGFLGAGFYFYGDLTEAIRNSYGENEYLTFLNIREPYFISEEEVNSLIESEDLENKIEFSENLKDEGYDGVLWNGDLREETMVFEPNQIKSATDNIGTFDSSNPSILFQNKTEKAIDNEYFDAINAGDMEKVQKMVEQKAKDMGFENTVPEQTDAYTLRTKPAPKKTIKVYKLFTVDKNGDPTALFVAGTEKLPRGVWIDAVDTWHFTAPNDKEYIPSTQNPNTDGGKTGTSVQIPSEEVRQELIKRGYLPKGSKAKTITGLAYRPGWHAGDEPFFPQGGIQDSIYTEDENAYVNLAKQIQEEEGVSENKAKNLREARYGSFEEWRDPERAKAHPYKNIHRYNQVVFECEMSIDNDYTETTEIKKGKNKGKIQFIDRQEMPVDGSYRYATNPATKFSDKGVWYIGGTLKINRPLSEAEANSILEKDGFRPQAWENGSLDLETLGVKEEQDDASRKTLAPITYDENGNIIPLSKRFDSSNPSILFQSDIEDGEAIEDYDDPYWDSINEEIEEVEEAMLADDDDILNDIEIPEITKEGNRPVPEAIQKKNEAKAERDKAKGKIPEPKEPASEKPRKQTQVKENLTDRDIRNLSRRFEHNTSYSSFTAKEIEWLVDAGVYIPSEVLVDVYNRSKDKGIFIDRLKEELSFRGRMVAELGDLKNGEAISIIKQADTVEQAVKYMRKYYGPEHFTPQREEDIRRLFGYVHTPTLSQMRKDFISKFATIQGVKELRSFYSIHPVVTRNADGTISQKLVVPTKSHSYNKLNEKHAGGWTDAHYNDVIEDMKHHTSQWVRDYLHQKASFEAVQYNRSKDNPQMMKTQAEIAFLAFSHADDTFLNTVESMQVGENIAESKELKSLYGEITKNNNAVEGSIDALIQNIDNVQQLNDEEKERIREEARQDLETVIEEYSEILETQEEFYKNKIKGIRESREYQNKRRLIQNGIKRLLNVDLTKYDFYAVSPMSFVYNLMHNKFAQYQFGAMNDAEYFEYRTLRGEEEQDWIVFNNIVTETDENGNEIEVIKDVEFNEGADLKSIQAMPEALKERLPQELIDKIEMENENFRWLSLDNNEMMQIFDALNDIKQEARSMKLYKDTKKKLDKQRMAIDAASSIRKSTSNIITDEIRKEYYDRTGIDESKDVSDNDIMIWYQQNIKAFDGDTKEFGVFGEGANKIAAYVGKIHRLARFLDGNKEGAIYDIYVNKPTEALREEKRNSNERKAKYSERLQEILNDKAFDDMDIKAKQKFLRGAEEVLMNGGGKTKLKGWDIVGINAYSRNFRGFLKLINPKGNNISLYEMARINPEATKKFLELDMREREAFLEHQKERLEKLYNKKLNMTKKNEERRQYLEAQRERWIKNNQKKLEEEISKKRKKALTEERRNEILEQYAEKEQEITDRYDKKINKVDMFDYSEINKEIEDMAIKTQKAISNFTGVLKIGKEGSDAYNEEVDVLEKLNNGYDFGSIPSFVSKIADLLIETASERSDASQKYAYENENMILTLQEEYYPFISKKGSVDAVIGGIHNKKNVNNGNLKARVNTIYELDTDVGNNIFGIIDKQEHLIAFGQLIKDLNWIGDANGGNLYSIVEQKFGKEMSKMLNDYVKDLAGMKTDPSIDNKLVGRMLNNASVAVLANPMVILKQFLSLIPALTSDEISTGEWVQAFMLNAKSEVVTETYEHYAPEIAHGPMSVAIEQIHDKMQKSQMSEFQKKAFQKMMFLAEFVDDLLKKTIWYSKFNHEINAMSESGMKIIEKDIIEAANKASTLVKSTQSTTDILSQSSVQREMRKNNYKKLLFMFSNDVFNMWNIIYGDIPNAWKNGKTKQAIKMAMGVTTSALILALLKGGWLPDDEEKENGKKFDAKEFVKDFMLTSLGYSIPVVGVFAENWDSPYSSNLLEQLINDSARDIISLVSMPLSDKDYEAMDYLDKVFDITMDVGKFVGAPTILFERFMKIPFPEGLAGGFNPSIGNVGYLFGSNWGNL